MFEDNWYLFLLIVMIVFISDGDFSRRETAVMIGILAALRLRTRRSLTCRPLQRRQTTAFVTRR